jgi:hypothetical protein
MMPRGLRSSSVNVPVCDSITARAIDNPSPNPLLLFMPRAASPRISKTYRPDPVRRVMMDVNQSERDALVVRGYWPKKNETMAPHSKRRLSA